MLVVKQHQPIDLFQGLRYRTIRRHHNRPEPEGELDMDTILDKINKSGMDSLTQEEKDFLYNL